jgi:oxygen-independent coproporphyrinogen-3 oxidase
MYVHVPFCAKTCDFCAFYQVQPKADSIDEYLATLELEAQLVNWDRPVTTVFWGGGTPGLLAPRDLERLGDVVRKRAGGSSLQEWTVELAPASVTDARLKVLKELGVTRVSMGVQSFQPDLLDALGRQHTREQIFAAYDKIRAAQFASVNLDLIFAIPGQSESDWLNDLRQAFALAPDHLSTYCLTFEEDTALWVKLAQGKVKLDPEREAALYEQTWAELDRAGFAQYEISNFAKPGHACKHNLNTWRMQSWVGLGPSGASQHQGWRGANVADLAAWRAHVLRGDRATEDRAALTPRLLVEDALIFGLRMNEGVDLVALTRQWPNAPWKEVHALLDRFVADGLASRTAPGRCQLTLAGRLLADAIGSEIMGAFSSSEQFA